MIGQYKCTWTKPVAIEGLDAKDFVNTVFNEVIGTSARITATGVAHLATATSSSTTAREPET